MWCFVVARAAFLKVGVRVCVCVCGAVTILDGNAVSCCGRRTTSKAGVHVRGVFWIVRLDLVGSSWCVLAGPVKSQSM